MMKTQRHDLEQAKNQQPDKQIETVRGSGFTYTEEEQPTDRSVPITQADELEIVPLPDLGMPNRP